MPQVGLKKKGCRFKGLFGESNVFATNKHDFDVGFRQTSSQFSCALLTIVISSLKHE